MIAHYIKVSFRTLWKYKVQSLLSLIGLSVAFACVSLALYWSHYEENYDSFHRNADRIYQCRIEYDYSGASYKNGSLLRIPIYMEETYPEVEKACITSRCIKVDDNTYYMAVTPGATRIFDFECIEGNSNMETWNENQVGVSEEYARKHFGESSPIGRKITCPYYKEIVGEVEIVAVYKTWSRHSNFRYDLLGVLKTEKWIIPNTHFYVLLNSKSNHKQVIEKLQKDTIKGISRGNFKIKSMIPLKSLYYTVIVR